MTTIIGAGTSVLGFTGVVSVNWDMQVSAERLWVLGSWSPYATSTTSVRTMSVTVYGGGNVYDVTPSTSCTDVGTINLGVAAAGCGASSCSFSADFHLTGYSYSKDVQGYGKSTFNFSTKPLLEGYSGDIIMLRGISTGQASVGSDYLSFSDQGITFSGDTVESEAGSVSAGSPGIGECSTKADGMVTSVGGGTGKADGFKGEASCSITVTPVYQ